MKYSHPLGFENEIDRKKDRDKYKDKDISSI
jgi:hypothetical protein